MRDSSKDVEKYGFSIEAARQDAACNTILDYFFGYASYKIQEQAIPCFFDGLVPAQKKNVLSMVDQNALPGKKTKKSSQITASTASEYHPVGDTYNVIVNMAQWWKNPAMLVDPEGSWGSQEGNPAAALRYTEIRLSPLMEDILLKDLPSKRYLASKDQHGIVPCSLTYTDTYWEEDYLPVRIPLLPLNGGNGIAIGVAQTWQQLNARDLFSALNALTYDKDISEFSYRPGYATDCAILTPQHEIDNSLRTGRGSIKAAFRYSWRVERGRVRALVLTHAHPNAQFNDIGDEFKEWKKIDPEIPFSEFKNESERRETFLVLSLKQPLLESTASPEDYARLLKAAYSNLSLHSSYTINQVALFESFPRLVGMSEYLQAWLQERERILVVVSTLDYQDKQQQKRRIEVAQFLRANMDSLSTPIRELADGELFKILSTSWRAFNPGLPEFDEVDFDTLLALNIRQISKKNEADLISRKERLQSQMDELYLLMNDHAARMVNIREDLDYIKNKHLGSSIHDSKCSYDADLAEIISSLPKKQKKGVPVKAKKAKQVKDFSYLTTPSTASKDILIQTKKGFIRKVDNRAVKSAEYNVELMGDDQIIRAEQTDNATITLLTDGGSFINVSVEEMAKDLVHSVQILERAKFKAPRVEGNVHLVPCVHKEPTHLFVTYSDNTCKKVPILDLNFRSSFTKPEADILFAAFVNDVEYGITNIRDVSQKARGRLPVNTTTTFPLSINKQIQYTESTIKKV